MILNFMNQKGYVKINRIFPTIEMEFIEENNMEKKFKCKDEVIFRYDDGSGMKSYWTFGIFSHYQGDDLVAIGNMVYGLDCTEVLPYEGNEHLVGTYDEPSEEIKLKTGEILVLGEYESSVLRGYGMLQRFSRISSAEGSDRLIIAHNDYGIETTWKFCIPLSKFNPDDMEATKKEILTVVAGKLVKTNK